MNGPTACFCFPLFWGKLQLPRAKLGLFLCSLDNLLQKNVLVLFLEIKFQDGTHLIKGLFLIYFSHFLVTRESYKNSFSTYLNHIHICILLTIFDVFCLTNFEEKKIRIYQVCFLFGVIPGVDSYSHHFVAINK